ncbi:MAG TPA: hypothetical protein VGS23_07105 [Thermoplasmata archaeon]|nr:hypothetical protein [Thermoplasmata archaeon]
MTTPSRAPRSEAASGTAGTDPALSEFEPRLELLVRVAEEMGTDLRIPDLLDLLPARVSERQVLEWVRRRPELARIDGAVVVPAGGSPGDRVERRARGQEFVRLARSFVEGPLGPLRSRLRCVGISGSTAYGEPRDGDDIDFIVITRPDAVWLFLSYCYLALRLRKPRTARAGKVEWCFNLVLDEASALQEFGRPRGFLIAREALTVRVLWGEEYYQALLGATPWLGTMIPRLFERRAARNPPTRSPAPPWFARLANVAIFPWLAAYLQAVALVRNDRYRNAGLAERIFSVRTRLHGISFESVRFDRLIGSYERSLGPTRAANGSGGAPVGPSPTQAGPEVGEPPWRGRSPSRVDRPSRDPP